MEVRRVEGREGEGEERYEGEHEQSVEVESKEGRIHR